MKSKIRKTLLLACLCVICFVGKAQTVIQMEEYGGVYRIPCKVNGAKMKLIFDTGAEKVCLSLSMANYLYDNDYITDEDIVGSGTSTVADGSIVDHIKIIIKDIEIEGVHLRNVEAVVIDGQNAPLLFGQSALRRLGKYTISGNTLILGTNNSSSQKELTDEELYQMLEEADKAFFDEAFYIALEKFKILYDHDRINAIGIIRYADCYYFLDKYEEALELYQSVQNEIETDFPDYKTELYYDIGCCLYYLKSYDEMFPYMEKVRYLADSWSFYEKSATVRIMDAYSKKGDEYRAKKIMDNYISSYLSFMKFSPTDCWTKNSQDQFLAELYYHRSFATDNYNDYKKYLIISACWGCDKAIKSCQEKKIRFHIQPTNYTY